MSDMGLLINEELNFSTSKSRRDEKSLYVDEKKDESSDKVIKIIKTIFVILCIFLVAELVVYKYVMPCFSSPKVTLKGQNAFSPEEIAMKLLPMNSTNWVDFNVEQAVAILSSEPGIENVTVEKKFPDKIFINIKERVPVAITFVMDEGISTPLEIDDDGVLFPVKNNANINTNQTPIISGLQVEHMAGGMRIPSKYKPLMEQIKKISESGKNYFAGISEICILSKDTGSYELALIPSQSKIKVLTDRSLNEESLKYMMVVLDILKDLETEVSEVDLRYGSISCK